MEHYYRKTFMSWDEEGQIISPDGKGLIHEKTRAIALCDGNWFDTAINTLRDGAMGKKDENGVYERKWYGDDIYNADVEDVRPANLSEVGLYLMYCSLEYEAKLNGQEVVAIIKGAERTDVIFRKK